jgi:hypothetical protein
MAITGVSLSSEDRTIQENDPGDCYVSPKYNTSGPDRPRPGGFQIRLSQVVLPRGWYGITPTTNQIVIQDADFPLDIETLVITPGDYSAATFATALQTRMNQGAGVFGVASWVVSVNPSTYKLTITNSDNQNFNFLVDSGNFTANEAMGLPKIRGGYPASYFSSDSFSWTSPFAVRTLHVNFVYVLIDWPGINTVVTSKRITGSEVVSQTGMRPVVCKAVPRAEWASACRIELLSEKYWTCQRFPTGNVRMQLLTHDWEPVVMGGEEWSVDFDVFDMPGAANAPNHVTVADAEGDLRRPSLPDRDLSATAGDALPPEGRASLVVGRVHQRTPGPNDEGSAPKRRRFINTREPARKNG